MRKIIGVMLGVLMVVGYAGNARAAEEKMDEEKAAAPMGQMDEAQMQKMKEMGSPGEHHKNLEALAGKWNYTMKWWMNPDSVPDASQGTSTNTWMMNGRFLKQEVTGSHMGEPFEGMGITGYDNMKGEYTSFWIDSGSTSMMTSSSQYDPAIKTFEEKGSFACPMTGEKDKKFRAITKIIDNDHFTYEMYSTPMSGSGAEFKTMEITYERAK
jgi:hypothetical protein